MNNVSFIGMAGCGKSTIGNAAASKFNLSFIDTDLLIEKEFDMSLENIKKEFGYKFVRSAEENPSEGADSLAIRDQCSCDREPLQPG